MALRRVRTTLSVCLVLFALQCAERISEVPRPPGIPAGAELDRKTGLWTHQTAELHRTFFADGKLAQAGPVRNGLREGLWKSYSMDGKVLISEGRYLNGRRDGTWHYRDNAGQLYLVMRYAPKPFRTFGIFTHPDYGNENGYYERYFPDGRLEERGLFRGGFYEGPMVRYHRNGRVAVRGSFTVDKKTGTWTYYYPEGTVERTESYQNGLLHGELRNYHPDGSAYQRVVYQRGARERVLELNPR